MKQLFFIFLITSTITKATFGQFASSQPATGKGVAFVQGNLRTAFDLAKAQNKLVFVEVYSPTCHVCQSFVPVFEDASVGNTYNPSFVSYKLDINSQEGQAFLAKQKIWVPSLPLFLFFDKDVKLQHLTLVGEGTNQPATAIKSGTDAKDPQRRFSAFGAMFDSGYRDTGFLIDYGYYSRIVKDTVRNKELVKAYAKTQAKTALSSQVNFLILQKVVLDTDNDMFGYMINHLDEYYKKYTRQAVVKVGENIILSTLYSSKGLVFSLEKIYELKSYMTKLGIDKKSIDNRTLVSEINALFRSNKADRAIQRIDEFIKTNGPGPKEYEYLCRLVRSKTHDPKALVQAAEWCKKGGIQ